jgi:hypothetical protein
LPPEYKPWKLLDAAGREEFGLAKRLAIPPPADVKRPAPVSEGPVG